MADLSALSIEEASRQLHVKEIRATELTEACLRRIEATDASVGSFLEGAANVTRAR